MRKDPTLTAIGRGGAIAALFVLVVAILVALVVVAGGVGAQEDSRAVATRTIDIAYRPFDEIAVPVIVDQLDPTTLLTVRASRFESDATGSVRQCTEGAQMVCRNPRPVRFDSDGAADFQYLVTDGGGCRLRDERCTIELRVGAFLSIIDTVFVDVAPSPGRITVTPRDGLRPGQTVTVSAEGFVSGATLNLAVCAAPSTSGRRCGAPGPDLDVVTNTDGALSVEIALDVQEVGADRVACGRQVACRMIVTSDEAAVRALPVRLNFDEGPGAAYSTQRVATGMAVALALVLVATWLVRSTSWTPPPEADGRAIDDADYADLDREAEQFDVSGSPVPAS